MDDRGEVIIYQTEDGLTKIDVTMQDETVWLSQADMSKLFQTTKQNVSLHITEIPLPSPIPPERIRIRYLE